MPTLVVGCLSSTSCSPMTIPKGHNGIFSVLKRGLRVAWRRPVHL
jgi:hypothetical protein